MNAMLPNVDASTLDAFLHPSPPPVICPTPPLPCVAPTNARQACTERRARLAVAEAAAAAADAHLAAEEEPVELAEVGGRGSRGQTAGSIAGERSWSWSWLGEGRGLRALKMLFWCRACLMHVDIVKGRLTNVRKQGRVTGWVGGTGTARLVEGKDDRHRARRRRVACLPA